MPSIRQTNLTLRMPVALRERLKKAAAKEGRKESQYIRFYLTRFLDQSDAQKEKA